MDTFLNPEFTRELNIIRLANNVSKSNDGPKRSSDVSNDSTYVGTTPASLAVELVHYKVNAHLESLNMTGYTNVVCKQELFSKLRFSYVEQVTKEKFLQAITSDTPLFTEPQENARLEAQLAEEKVVLKAQKEEVAKMAEDLERRGKELARRKHYSSYVVKLETNIGEGYEQIQLQKSTLTELPEKIAELEATIETLRTEHPSPAKSSNPNLNLPLPATLSLLTERESELSSLDSQIRALQATLPRKSRELDRLESELQPLTGQKKTVIAQAKEARKRREEGGVDDMEQKGRWYRASHTALQQMLGVEN
jgi:hypothetical protein